MAWTAVFGVGGVLGAIASLVVVQQIAPSYQVPEGHLSNSGIAVLTAIHFVFFKACEAIVYAARPVFLRWFDTRNRRLRLAAISTLHAAVVTVFSAYDLLAGTTTSTLRTHIILTFVLGYFIHDFTACITDIITHPSEAIHHVAAITITVGGGVVPEILAFVPGFLVIEASTIVYNITWFMLKTGNGNHRAYQPLLYTFAAMFFVLRCLWLPFVCYDLSFRNTEAYYKVPGIPQGIWVIVALQYYWMVLIFQKAMGGGKRKKGKDEGAESAATGGAGDKPTGKDEGAASSSDGKLRQRRQEADSSAADGDK